jgi:hypothetical protein
MRPVPIAATLIRLLGAFLPNTLAGTMDGNANSADAFIELLKNSRRDCLFFFILLSFVMNIFMLSTFGILFDSCCVAHLYDNNSIQRPFPPSPSPKGKERC